MPKCKGLARPVFEMKASQSSQGPQGTYALMPGASPGRSALWLSTTKIEVPGKGLCFWADGWAGLSFAPAGDSHIGVAAGTYVYLVTAMSFGQALTLPSFSTMVGQDCHLLRQGIHTLA